MERGTGTDAGRVSLNARLDLTYLDDMVRHLAQAAKDLGVSKISAMAAEKTDSGESKLEIEIDMKP